MSINIKLSKAQLAKIIHSGGFLGKILGNMVGNLGQQVIIDLIVPLAQYILPKLVTKATSSIVGKFEKKKVDKEL